MDDPWVTADSTVFPTEYRCYIKEVCSIMQQRVR